MADLEIVTKVKKQQKKGKKLRADTLIHVVIDASGSMGWITDATIEGFNGFIESQREVEGRALVTLTMFDSGYTGRMDSLRINRPYTALPLEDVPTLDRSVYRADGGTPLRDAVGDCIEETDDQLARVSRKDSPDVLMVIITDGGENSSQRYTDGAIKSMVEAREGRGWSFIYMGANQDSWAETANLGFSQGNVMNYHAADIQGGAFEKISAATSVYRTEARNLRAAGTIKEGETYATSAFFADAGVTEDGSVEVSTTVSDSSK